MKRLTTTALLLAFAAPLSGCGITGKLKTPPPIFGEAKADVVVDAAADNDPDTVETTVVTSDNPLDRADEDIGYGVDVADTP